MNTRLFGALIAAFASASTDAQTGSIHGKAMLEESGLPFPGVLVTVDAPQYYGRHPVDSMGDYLLKNVPVGTWNIEFHCPSANYVGREIATKSVIVTPGQSAKVEVIVPDMHCDEPPYAELRTRFRGHILFGFEHSGFLPCNEEDLKLSRNTFFQGNSIWVSNSIGERLLPDVMYYVEFTGVLRGPGRFGHLGLSDYEVVIENLVEARKVEKPNCAQD